MAIFLWYIYTIIPQRISYTKINLSFQKQFQTVKIALFAADQ
jgi:hypothetical protein